MTSDTINNPPKFLSILIALGVTFQLLCLIGQERFVSLGSFGIVCSTIFIYPFTTIILDIITEVYGYKVGRTSLWAIILSPILFAIVITLFTLLPISELKNSYTMSLSIIAAPLLHIVAVGTLSIIIGQYINIYLLSKLQKRFRGRHFIFRSILSSLVGDLATFIIALTGFFLNQIPFYKLLILFIDELTIMYLLAIILALPAGIIANTLKRFEPKSVVNLQIEFNPFSKHIDVTDK